MAVCSSKQSHKQWCLLTTQGCGEVQDEHGGGISDRPNDMVDVFHTFFGIASLSLMSYPDLQPIDPVFALPVSVVERLGLRH